MPLPVIEDVYRVAFNWRNANLGVEYENVMHFRQVVDTPVLITVALEGAVTADMWSATTTNTTIGSLDITKLDGGSLTQHYVTSGAPKWVGTQTAGDISPQVAALVKHVTGVRGRSHRGRSYLPAVAETANSNGTIVPGVVTELQTGWNNFLDAMTGADWAPVVASYLLATAEPITNYVVEALTATQRRRMHR